MSETNITVTSGTGSSTYEVVIGETSSTYEITSGIGSTDISVSYGDRGPAGPIGIPGPGGVARNVEIYVKAGIAVSAGAAVYISGASGANKIIALAQANTDSLSSKTLGLALQNLANNQFGYVVTEGDLSGLSINLGSGHGIVEGDPIWLSPTIPGGLVFGLANKPSAPNHLVFLGIVTRINGNTLTDVFVKVQNGFELEELHNVAISSPTNGQIISYNEATGLWSNSGIMHNVTSTNISGLLYGDGSKVKNILVTANPTPSQVVARDNEGGVNGRRIRLYNLDANFYTQINPSATNTSSVSFQFPLASGTIATNNTALMLSGAQTASGAKTFNGQVELTNQSISTGNSALNRDLADARYGTYSEILDTPVNSITTNYVPVVALTLQIGLYQIDAFLASLHTIGIGCKIRFATNKDIKVGLTDNYGRPSVAAFSWPIIDPAYNNSNVYSARSDSAGTEFRRTITGIIEVLEDNTIIRLDYAQLNLSTTNASTARARSHILARKIN